ncbi:MAG TPA: PKD domain-containing protein [Solirubrobacterales bacterium]|nr:PKD domain-containing protein [Solirubrobacterales bacterium]
MAAFLAMIATLALMASVASGATIGCFSNPSACGYPDATNSGVSASTSLTSSGSITAATNGQVIDGKDITGMVTVKADNVTIQNSKIIPTSTGSGSAAILVEDGATGTVIKDTTVGGKGAVSQTIEAAVRNWGGGTVAERDYFYNCNECWQGEGTIRDSYMRIDSIYSGAHAEDIYVCSGTVNVDHSTLINKEGQTATVFGDTICGGGNTFNVTNNLLAGGGFVLYPQANSSTKTGTMNVTGNRIARCKTSAVYNSGSGGTSCGGGADAFGYWPDGGYYGVAAYYYSGPGHVWENNVWDDNSQPVCANGSSGCGTGTTPPPPTNTPATAVWTAPTGAQVGVPVALNGSASTGDAPIACTWTVENQGGTVLDTKTGCQVSYTFLQVGTQYVRLSVTDANGDTNSNRKSFSVAAAPTPPPTNAPATAVWTAPTGAQVGVPVTLDGTASTGDGTITCTWSFENEDGSVLWEAHPGCMLEFTFQWANMKYVRLSVTDADGDTNSNRKSFSVAAAPTPPPTNAPATAVWTASPPADTYADTLAG